MSESYQEYQDSLKSEQGSLSRQEIKDQMERQAEYTVDLDNLPKSDHIWVKRGAKVSCEGAGHPHHSHFLVTR